MKRIDQLAHKASIAYDVPGWASKSSASRQVGVSIGSIDFKIREGLIPVITVNNRIVAVDLSATFEVFKND